MYSFSAAEGRGGVETVLLALLLTVDEA
eukprot:COSAG05_NODE_20297_length_280_cov_1.397790_1_plen_27_part_01